VTRVFVERALLAIAGLAGEGPRGQGIA
jgi:hypothetical protein